MKLVRKMKVNYGELICTGRINSLEENKPLAAMLANIEKNGIDSLLSDEKLKKFAFGLLHSFENDGFINAKALTPVGLEIVHSKKTWKELKGVFKLCVVATGNNAYIVDMIPQYGDDTNGFQLQKNAMFQFAGEYENSRGMHIKDIKLNQSCFVGKKQEVEIECVYDYKTDRNTYVVDIEGKKIEFPENFHTFKLVDSYDAKDLLRSVLANYGNFLVDGTKVVINNSTGNPLFENAIDEIFDKGSFNTAAADMSYEIKEIRAIVENEKIARGLLIKFLLQHAQEKYCGYGEIFSLISEFYGLFESCSNISLNTQTVYANLIEEAYEKNKTAYLRLRAYEDLMPDTIQKEYEAMRQKDFSNSPMSIADLVEQMIGKAPVKSVTLLTKYAYKNAAISRAINLFANSLRKQHRIPLHLITAKNVDWTQAYVAKEFYDALQSNPNIIFSERPIKEIEKIHDRYYRIERESGDVEWVKMTGELDAFRYVNDFVDGRTPNRDINEETVASVKEMTIVGVERKGIIPAVIKAMEG